VDFSREILFSPHNYLRDNCVAFLCFKQGGVVLEKWHYALIVFLGGCCYGILSRKHDFLMHLFIGGRYLLHRFFYRANISYLKQSKEILLKQIKR
jgi:hypothetical protein